MSQRVYRDDLRCPRCGSNRTPKYGHSRGKQTYRCGRCLYRFAPQGNRRYYSEEMKAQAVGMYVEGVGVPVICRTLGVKAGTVYSWIKKSPVGPDCLAGGSAAGAAPDSPTSVGQGDFL